MDDDPPTDAGEQETGPATSLLWSRPTFRTIGEFVDKERPDLLVIGTRGLTGVERILSGSAADAVSRGIECDILAVPPARETT